MKRPEADGGTFLQSHPGTNTTVAQQLMTNRQHRQLYTPPYESWLQPIESCACVDKQRCTKIVKQTEKLMDE